MNSNRRTDHGHITPSPLRRNPGAAPPPEAVVRELRASLRASEVYIGMVIDRFEVAIATGTVRLERVPAAAMLRLIAASEAFQGGADRILDHLDHGLANRTATIAEMMRDRSRAQDEERQFPA